MARKVKTTKRLRVRLDFTIELPVALDTLPVGGPKPANEWARHITNAAAKALCELLPHEKVMPMGQDVTVLPGGKVGLGLDFRPAKEGA